jgi:hypothetical protein
MSTPKLRFLGPLALSTVAVLAGLTDLRGGYYLLMHFVLSGVSAILLFESRQRPSDWRRLRDWQRWSLAGSVILFNPVLPISLDDRELWILLEFATLALLWVVQVKLAEWRSGGYRWLPGSGSSQAAPRRMEGGAALGHQSATSASVNATNPKRSPMSVKWRCFRGHDWVSQDMGPRPCPSCRSAAVEPVIVSFDGRPRRHEENPPVVVK